MGLFSKHSHLITLMILTFILPAAIFNFVFHIKPITTMAITTTTKYEAFSSGIQNHVGYMVQIRRDGKAGLHQSYVHCGATLITKRHLLTAAQCFRETHAGRFLFAAVFNTSSIYSRNVSQTSHQTFTYQRNVRRHPYFFPENWSRAPVNDVAIVTLNKAVPFETVCLADDDFRPSDFDRVTAYGWGRWDCFVASFDLLAVQGSVQKFKNCRRASAYYKYVNPINHLCLNYNHGGNSKNRNTTDEGDYGGPVIIKARDPFNQDGTTTTDIQVGIISGNDRRYINVSQNFGSYPWKPASADWLWWGCADSRKPTVATNIASYKRWILSIAPDATFC